MTSKRAGAVATAEPGEIRKQTDIQIQVHDVDAAPYAAGDMNRKVVGLPFRAVCVFMARTEDFLCQFLRPLFFLVKQAGQAEITPFLHDSIPNSEARLKS